MLLEILYGRSQFHEATFALPSLEMSRTQFWLYSWAEADPGTACRDWLQPLFRQMLISLISGYPTYVCPTNGAGRFDGSAYPAHSSQLYRSVVP